MSTIFYAYDIFERQTIFIIFTDNLITSKGPATAYAFGLAIVEKLMNKESAQKVADGLLYKDLK